MRANCVARIGTHSVGDWRQAEDETLICRAAVVVCATAQPLPIADANRRPIVIVVDDNLGFAENVAEIFCLQGFRSEIFESAEEALPRVFAQEVTGIVTDYRLPGLSGVDLVRRVRGQRAQVRAVVMSAEATEATVAAAREAGANGFLSKPLDFPFLIRLFQTTEPIPHWLENDPATLFKRGESVPRGD